MVCVLLPKWSVCGGWVCNDPREVRKPRKEGRSAAGAVPACPAMAGGHRDPCPESRRAPQGRPQRYSVPQTHPSLEGPQVLSRAGGGREGVQSCPDREPGQTWAAPLAVTDQGLLGLLPRDRGLWETRGRSEDPFQGNTRCSGGLSLLRHHGG